MFLTGPYKGAPFGLAIVVPAVAGPFNLGNVVVRAAISVDPHTAQITVTSDPLPTILQGIPLQVRTVNVSIDRPGFIFNPTNCDASLPWAERSRVPRARPPACRVAFQAANCATLPFKPSLHGRDAGEDEQEERGEPGCEGRLRRGSQANIGNRSR